MDNAEIKRAREYIRSHNLRISPSVLLRAARELGKSFAETIAFIMRMKQAGQNQQAQRRELLLRAAGE